MCTSSQAASDAWNHPLTRYHIPDFIHIGGGFDAIVGIGGATSFELNWVTRGPQASFSPAITTTQALGSGFSVDATINVVERTI